MTWKYRKPEAANASSAAVPTSAEEAGSAVGARLEEARKRLGLKQEEFAAAMGVALRTYHRYRHDEVPPRVPELACIAALGIDMNWLIAGSGSVMRQDTDRVPVSDELQTHSHVLPNEGGFVIDERLIIAAVTAIEAWLSERRRVLPSETKGKIVALLVEDAMRHREDERPARIREQTNLMLRLVA